MKKSIVAVFLSLVIFFLSVIIGKIQIASTNSIINDDLPIIIIDAGHGGEDGGAVSIDGTYEKDINLQIAIKLNEILSIMGFKTYMIRTTDTAIHTEGETIRARKISDIRNRTNTMTLYDNCLYVSIHQNKYGESSIWGAQTFYSPNDERSKELAQFIQSSISSQLQTENERAIKKSGTDIYVLYNATKPAVMVECGFVSNPNELNQLKNSEYQTNMALSIAVGIINYNISEV